MLNFFTNDHLFFRLTCCLLLPKIDEAPAQCGSPSKQGGGGHLLRGGRVTLRVGVVAGRRHSPHREGYNHAKICDSRIGVNFSLKVECNRQKP